tara:strand:+ start:895 stop:1494 length:600 start_codon:yes stop_codon:yes gene_type:complete
MVALYERGFGIMISTLKFTTYSSILAIGIASSGALAQVNGMSEEAAEFRELMWEDLMSPADLAAILNAPMLSHDSFGWEDQLGGDPADDAYKNALQSFDVNPEVLNEPIMIPGFIVPTAYDDDRRITEFFLVPYFGACIHLPPPPPNQIIYVRYQEGVSIDDSYEPHAVRGELTSEVMRNNLADSAYSIEADAVEIYTY